MAKPFVHAYRSAERYGGKPEDYMELHTFIDSSKSTLADVRHRAILHSTFGCFLVEKVFGYTLTNSDGGVVGTRDLAEEHIREDLGFIPTVEYWLRDMPIEKWMHGEEGDIMRQPVERQDPFGKGAKSWKESNEV